MHDPISARLIGKEVVHGSGAETHLSAGPFQYVGGPDGPPELSIKIVILDATKEFLFMHRTALSSSTSLY